ncbi:transglycosylase domain-containing protein [Marmoricola sp. RAF53]|uniref:transglycosylase domain-containing protein n=1 Tax=Marmoricola sp. RAF53 TaxID=3233059 RepID=UPI003F99AAB2
MSRRPNTLTPRDVISQLAVIVALSVLMGILVAGLAIPFAGALGIGGKALSKGVKNLPEELAAEPLAQRTRVLDVDGKTIATFYDENRVNVTLDNVAPIMRQAIVAIEDYRFYQHGAIDLKGTLRAFLTNQANSGITQGGSSITQQMAKMTQLSQAKSKAEREAATADTYQRKIQELRYAIGFEQKYSKDWILERYLNIAYFGDGAYGIQAAARHYFSKNASDLDTAEAALLAGLVKNPVGYDPTRFEDKALARRNTVLRRMAQLKIIPAAEADQLQQKPLGLEVRPDRNGCLGSKAPFFCDYVRRYLLADPALGATVEDRKQLLNSGGLTIKTTVDLRYQKAADKSTAAHVLPTDNAIGALAMVQPGTGNVLAISQSRPMGRAKKKGQTFLNYVVDHKYGDSNGFQAGSTFKVFVLASALEQGLPTSTAFNSPPKISIPQNEFQTCDGPYPVYSDWSPSNSTTSGRKDMYSGTQESVNTFYAQLEKKTGLCKPYALARSMGVDLSDPTHERVPSFTLGIADVSPLEMAGAYATFAARGLHCDNRPVARILNSAGRVFKNYPKKCQQVMQQSTADTVNDILRGVMVGRGFGAGLALDKPSAGKTGTINENMAVWFDGYTPSVATSSMIAGANQLGHWVTLNGQTIGGQYVATAHGSTNAGPMWADAMRAIQDLMPDQDFVKPLPSELSDANLQIVPNVTGMTRTDATATLENLGFSVVVGGQVSSDLGPGLVALTNPASGATMYSGGTVTLYVSSGPAAVTPASPSGTPQGQFTPQGGQAGTTNNGPGRGNGNGNGHGGGHH